MGKTVIIGAGTFGLSTALHLLRQGQKDVVVVDKYPVPSPLSAGNDVNKIMQSSATHPFYGKLALDALEMWRDDPVFKHAFHETGIVYATKAFVEELRKSREFKEDNGLECVDVGLKKLKEMIPDTVDEENDRFKDWVAFYQTKGCGWTFAVKALELCAAEIEKLGGKIVVNEATEIVFGSEGEVTGVKCQDGQIINCDKCVLAAGAQSYKFLDFQGQLLAKCWTVGHIRLDEEERKRLKGIPVLLSYDHGFLFEPDSNGDVKFCNEFPGYINMENNESVPLYKDAIPQEAEDYMRAFLAEVFPKLSKREFSVAKICWCTDTADRDFLIGVHPEHRGLILGTGDSGQGFKFMPIIGKYISSVVIEGDEGLDEEKRQRWRWRPEAAKNRDIHDLQKRSGGTDKILDLQDVKQWSTGEV